jgi:hypothetical protein
MNWKWNERIVFFTIIGILILIITMLIFFPNVETVDDFTTAGYCYGIDDYSIRIENITYHCSLISVENKDSYVGKYGDEGDTFTVDGIKYCLTQVTKVSLGSIRDCCYDVEGCRNPEHFEKVWVEIHPRKGWVDKQKVWFHRFERIR